MVCKYATKSQALVYFHLPIIYLCTKHTSHLDRFEHFNLATALQAAWVYIPTCRHETERVVLCMCMSACACVCMFTAETRKWGMLGRGKRPLAEVELVCDTNIYREIMSPRPQHRRPVEPLASSLCLVSAKTSRGKNKPLFFCFSFSCLRVYVRAVSYIPEHAKEEFMKDHNYF